jgi:hypothetical protein
LLHCTTSCHRLPITVQWRLGAFSHVRNLDFLSRVFVYTWLNRNNGWFFCLQWMGGTLDFFLICRLVI